MASGMSVKRMYLVLLAAAVVVGSLLRLLDAGVAAFNLSALSLGQTMGRVVGLFLFAALVPTVMVLFYRKPIASAAPPTAVGMVVLAIVAYSLYSDLEFRRTTASFVFQTPSCTFSASFPGEPERKETVGPGGSLVTQADFYGSDTLMRAECFATEAGLAPTREALMAELRNHAERSGLMDVKFDFVEFNRLCAWPRPWLEGGFRKTNHLRGPPFCRRRLYHEPHCWRSFVGLPAARAQ